MSVPQSLSDHLDTIAREREREHIQCLFPEIERAANWLDNIDTIASTHPYARPGAKDRRQALKGCWVLAERVRESADDPRPKYPDEADLPDRATAQKALESLWSWARNRLLSPAITTEKNSLESPADQQLPDEDAAAKTETRPATSSAKGPHGHKLAFFPGGFSYKTVRIELRDRPLQVLEAFARATDNTLTLSELYKEFWADSDSGEETVKTAVSDARKALRNAIKQAKVKRRKKHDPIPNVDRGPKRTAWRLDLP